jgi:HSP20 family protein
MYTTKTRRNYSNTIFPDIDALMGDLLNTDISKAVNGRTVRFTQPKANVIEFNDRFELGLTTPGMDKSEIKLKVEKNVLSISAEVNDAPERKFRLREFAYGTFNRKFILPEIVNITEISATMNNGILTIVIPKKKEAMDNGPKEINIV